MKRINNDKRRTGITTLLLLCFSLLVPSVLGQQNRSTIGGMVFDSQRSPVTQIPVELMNDFNSVIQRMRTDSSGRFFFRNISSGRYVVRVLPLGTDFEEQTQDVDIGGFGVDGRPIADSVQLEFHLRLRRKSSDIVEAKGVLFAQDIPQDARKLYEAAVSDLEANRLEAGVIGLERAIQIFPTYYLALTKLGLVYIGQQKFENARDAFSRAVALNERSFTGWYGLGYADYSLNNADASIVAFQKALELEKNSVNTLFLLGIAHRRVKNYEAAEKSLLQAKKLDNGKTPDINWNLALLYAHNLKRYKDAATELETYLKNDPNVPNKDAIKKLIKQFRENPPASN
jgi:cytochrome c-type biogenesis protein CcmH/NrfG